MKGMGGVQMTTPLMTGLGGVLKTRPVKQIHKNKIKKKRRVRIITLRKIIPDIVTYLKSDSYFYSHLISSSAPFDSPSPLHVYTSSSGEPILANKQKVKEKLEQYLKSDTYLYTPLEGTQRCDNFAVKTVISPPRGQELQFMRLTSTVLPEKVAWQTKNVAENSVVEKSGDHGSKCIAREASVLFPKTPGLQEVKKQAARRSTRLSTISG